MDYRNKSDHMQGKSYTSWQLNGKNEPLIPVQKAYKAHTPYVKLHFAALNHRDYWITKGLYPGIEFPVVLGSDGVGTFEGRTILLNPNINWGANENFPSKDYEILGLKFDGTFAEYVQTTPDKIFDKPSHLTDSEAAALPLAGLTAYRAVFTKGQLQPHHKILITGIGGGVAQMALHFAVAQGAEVYVTSSSADKIEKSIELGAKAGYNYRTEDWEKQVKKEIGLMDIIIDSAGGPDFTKLIYLTTMGGKIVNYGGTNGKITQINPAHIFFKQMDWHGTTMGSDSEFKNMVSFVEQHKVRPIVDKIFDISEINEALAYMKTGKHFGKIVLKIN